MTLNDIDELEITGVYIILYYIHIQIPPTGACKPSKFRESGSDKNLMHVLTYIL